jgi:chemotaxis regulatin CheY-phosphate phosphatase CheZ
MPMTIEERERLAYIEGRTEEAALLQRALDGDEELHEQNQYLEAENTRLQKEVDELEHEVEDLGRELELAS